MADSTTNLDTIETAQAQKEVTANELFDAASPATALGRRASTTAGLTWGYYGGVVTLDDESLYRVANGTKALTNSATNYIELDTSDGTVDINTSAWTGAAKKRLYKIVVAGGVVTSYEDWRTAGVSAGAGSGGVSDGDKGDITVSSSGAVWTIDNDAITYAKMQNVSATDQLLGRSTAGAGNVEEIACTAFARSILDDADAAAVRATIGAGTGTGTGDGTVTSVAMTVPAEFSVAGSPVTTAGTLAVTKANQSANQVWAGPASGADAAPAFRALVAADLPAQPFIVVPFFPGSPTASQLLGVFPAPAGITTLTFAAAIAGSSGKALTAATAQTDIDVRKNATTAANGTSVGTVRFAAAGSVPTFIAASGFTLTGGTDYLSLWAPATPDATLANFAIALYATR